tara:strand:+ start:124 stop:585 length:462 start_codon:yes stop_codon:yes gene_type:complete
MEIPEEELKNIKSWHLYLRIAYVLAAALLAAAACLMLETQPAAGIAFFSVYVFCFSLLIAAFELHLSMVARVIAQNFGFMYSFSGRWIFLLFVGFMAFSLGDIGKSNLKVFHTAGIVCNMECSIRQAALVFFYHTLCNIISITYNHHTDITLF